MFVSSNQYREAITKLIEDNELVKVAAAFWGDGAEKMFPLSSGKHFEILCNLTMGGTNPAPIQVLLDQPNVTIRMLNDLHAKVVIGKDSVIVGSANFSSNGLNLELDEAGGWKEAGIVSNDPTNLKDVEKWFANLWTSSLEIKSHHLEEAKAQWLKRRASRPRPQQPVRLLDAPLQQLKDLPIYLVMYQESASVDANEAFKEVKEGLNQDEERPIHVSRLSFFENWGKLPKKATLLGVRYGVRRGLKLDAPCVRIPELDGSPSVKKKKVNLQFTVGKSDVEGMEFGKDDREKFKQMLKPQIDALWKRFAPKGTRVVSLFDALSYLKYELPE